VKKFGFKTVYDKSYPPSTVDYTPIARAIKAVNPDVVFVASYPPDSVGMVRAAAEVGLQPKIFGGGMVGLQFTTVMTSLGPMLNGIVNYDFWAPESTMMFPGIKEFFAEYQKRAKEAGVDTLGYYLPPFAYSAVQILGSPSRAARASTSRRSPTTSARTSSARSSARCASGPTASGRSRASFRCSIRASRAATSSSSGSRQEGGPLSRRSSSRAT
jgi:ABC-type branched-subunit amino acid transport system substrate-binding protein